jgi:hypothetical protein
MNEIGNICIEVPGFKVGAAPVIEQPGSLKTNVPGRVVPGAAKQSYGGDPPETDILALYGWPEVAAGIARDAPMLTEVLIVIPLLVIFFGAVVVEVVVHPANNRDTTKTAKIRFLPMRLFQ